MPAEKLAESRAVHPSLVVVLLGFFPSHGILKPIIKTNLLNAFVEEEHSRHGMDFLLKLTKEMKFVHNV